MNQPAIVKSDPNDYLSYLFTGDSDGFGQVPIKPDPGYFRKLPKSYPQFFYLELVGDNSNKITARFMTNIIIAVDFAALKNMLGK